MARPDPVLDGSRHLWDLCSWACNLGSQGCQVKLASWSITSKGSTGMFTWFQTLEIVCFQQITPPENHIKASRGTELVKLWFWGPLSPAKMTPTLYGCSQNRYMLVILGGWHDALSGGFVYFCFPMVHVNNTVDGFPGKHPSQPGLVPSKKGVEDTDDSDDRIQSKTCLFCQEWSEG